MKNKQLVINLHEGCLDPEHPFIKMFQEARNDEERRAILYNYMWNRISGDFDSILIDKIEIIDCDCNVGD